MRAHSCLPFPALRALLRALLYNKSCLTPDCKLYHHFVLHLYYTMHSQQPILLIALVLLGAVFCTHVSPAYGMPCSGASNADACTIHLAPVPMATARCCR